MTTGRRPWGSTRDRVANALQELGPMTRVELCRELGIERQFVSAVVSRMHKSGRLHILEYTYDDEVGARYPRAVYAYGPGDDAKKPQASHNANSARCQQRLTTRIRTSSVFNLGLTRDQTRALKKRVEVEVRGGQDQQ